MFERITCIVRETDSLEIFLQSYFKFKAKTFYPAISEISVPSMWKVKNAWNVGFTQIQIVMF